MASVSNRMSWRALLVFIIVTWCAALIGMQNPPDAWYRQLQRPSFAPPDWVFGPVWTILYTTMAIAAWLVWRRRPQQSVKAPMIAYGTQLALNAAWSPLFFGAHRIDAALIVILLLWSAIATTIFLFWTRSRPAATLLLPYLAWVTFATALNFEFWRLNA